MSDIKYYLLFNPELSSLSKHDLLKEYENDLSTNNRVTSIKSFFAKFPNFNINTYKKENPETEKYSMIDTLVNAYIYNNAVNSLQNSNIIPEVVNTKKISIYKESSDYIKIAHIFVHFFKIGGGEAYLKNLNYWIKYKDNLIKQKIFVNKKHKNETLFNYDANIIYYNSYEELNEYLLKNNFTIIIDHQLYWFDENITKKSFRNINPFKIIRITHGVPIHHKDIQNLNYTYSIELYNDIKCHLSWNKHIKLYKNIGVQSNFDVFNQFIFDENMIKVVIVGRICEDKVPQIFLRKLIAFCEIYKNYNFKFYGIYDDSYKHVFTNIIRHNKNISYEGYVEPENINKIYTQNDILMHPSKSEAGATVILEAMSYGMPVICMNNGGMSNALKDSDFLSIDYDDIFNNLISINSKNYDYISQKNMLKVLNENNQKQLFLELVDDILLLNKVNFCNSNDNIPNIIHYIFGLKEQTEPFSFIYYMSIYSAFLINKPDIIFFHYQYEPYGYWWDKAKKYVKLNYVNCDNISWGEKKIYKYAHKADKLRLDILLKYGGIYMDIDTITYKPYKDLLEYDFVIGIQEENYEPKNITLYCNAILMAKKDSLFIKRWIDSYEKNFNPDGWCEASVHLPYYVLKFLDKKDLANTKIKIVQKEVFYYPSYDNVEEIFEEIIKDGDINEPKIDENLITLHLWNTYSEKYYKDIDWKYVFKYNTIYSKIVRSLIKNYLEEDIDINLDLYEIEQSKESIIIIYNESNKDNYSDFFTVKNTFLKNIQYIIIDNGTKSLYNLIYKNHDLKTELLSYGIEVKIIELHHKIYNEEICRNIGLEHINKMDDKHIFDLNNISCIYNI